MVAEVADRDTIDPLHDEVGASGGAGTGVEDASDIGMVHHGEGLALGVEAREHLPAVHAELDDFEGYLAAYGADLFGEIDGAHAAFADEAHESVGAEAIGFGVMGDGGRMGRTADGGGHGNDGFRDGAVEAVRAGSGGIGFAQGDSALGTLVGHGPMDFKLPWRGNGFQGCSNVGAKDHCHLKTGLHRATPDAYLTVCMR